MVLKPTLQWLLSTTNPGPLRAEFSYVTGGLTWEADYNIVAPEKQNYRADPVSELLLLSLSEGKTIDFLVQRENKQEVVSGKIIRSGYVPHSPMAMCQYGPQYYQAQMPRR